MNLLMAAIIAVTVGSSPLYAADENDAPVFAEGTSSGGLLLVEETASGSGGEVILAETAPSENGSRPQILRSITVGGPSPFLTIGGRLGVETRGKMFEAGVDAFIFYYPPREGAEGGGAGLYLNFTPIPGSWGRRFYIQGKSYLAAGFGRPTYNAFGAGVGLGYRHPLENNSIFIELGAERAWLYKYEEAVYMLDVLRAGMTW